MVNRLEDYFPEEKPENLEFIKKFGNGQEDEVLRASAAILDKITKVINYFKSISSDIGLDVHINFDIKNCPEHMRDEVTKIISNIMKND